MNAGQHQSGAYEVSLEAPRQPSASTSPLASIASALRSAADVIEAGEPRAAPDDLLPFPFGLEAEAARAVVRNGNLRTAKIGRKRYARRSALLAMVDRLADEEAMRAAAKPLSKETPAQALERIAAAPGPRRRSPR